MSIKKNQGLFADIRDIIQEAIEVEKAKESNIYTIPGFGKPAPGQLLPLQKTQSESQPQSGSQGQQQSMQQSRQQSTPSQQQRRHSRRVEQQQQQTRAQQQRVAEQRRRQADAAAPAQIPQPGRHPGRELVANMDSVSARNAIILSEIIGSPLSKRPRGR